MNFKALGVELVETFADLEVIALYLLLPLLE